VVLRVLKTKHYEIEYAIYFSVICDATPDISHTEKNVLLVRYVHRDKVQRTGEWEIIELFSEFKEFARKTGSEISEMILSALEGHGIDMADCRGQGYDSGGANISAKVREFKHTYCKRIHWPHTHLVPPILLILWVYMQLSRAQRYHLFFAV
jgi:hypothetical protein